MNRLSRIAILALFPILTGCPGGSSAYIDDVHAILIDLTRVVAEITDRQSAEAARESLQSLSQRMDALQKEYKDVVPTAEQLAEYNRVVGQTQTELMQHFQRLALNPETRLVLDDLDGFGSKSKKPTGSPWMGAFSGSDGAGRTLSGTDTAALREQFAILGADVGAAMSKDDAAAARAAMQGAAKALQEGLRQAQLDAVKKANQSTGSVNEVSPVTAAAVATSDEAGGTGTTQEVATKPNTTTQKKENNPLANAVLRGAMGANLAPLLKTAQNKELRHEKRREAVRQAAPLSIFTKDAKVDKALVALLDEGGFENEILGVLALRLEEVAKTSPSVINTVIALTKEDKHRPLALEALAHSGKAGVKALPELIKQLKTEKNTYMINKLVTVIGGHGTAAKDAIPVFEAIIKENRGYAGERTKKLLAAIKGK